MKAGLRPCYQPVLWLVLWWIAIAIVVTTSLLPERVLLQVPQGGDKIEHITAYFILAFGAVQLFVRGRTLWIAIIGLLMLGGCIEIAQGLFTVDRTPDLHDFFANAIGIFLGLATAWTALGELLVRLDQRLFGE